MRVLLDNCVPRKLAVHLAGHAVTTVAQRGWNSLNDGALLDAAEGECDVFITMDKSIPFQQQLEHRNFAVILLRANSNRIEELLPLIPVLLTAIGEAEPAQLREIGSSPL